MSFDRRISVSKATFIVLFLIASIITGTKLYQQSSGMQYINTSDVSTVCSVEIKKLTTEITKLRAMVEKHAKDN